MARHILRVSKGSMTSTVLNVIGMAMAFASMYLILLQISYDLGYNKKIKDHERIYAIALPDWYDAGRYMTSIARPLWEDATANLPSAECGGCSLMSSENIEMYKDRDCTEKIAFDLARISSGFIGTFGMEAAEGTFGDLSTNSDIAISESKARELGIGSGDALYSKDNSGKTCQYSVVAIFKDMPVNSDFHDFDALQNLGDRDMEDYSEWSYNYFVKLHSPEDKDEFERQSIERILKTIYESEDGSEEGISGEEAESVRKRMACKLFPIGEIYFDRQVKSSGRSGNRTTTMTLLAIAVLVTVIAFINFVNFFFALVPVRLRSINTRKILGASRASLVMGIIAESAAIIAASLILAGILVKIFTGTHLAPLISGGTALSENMQVAALTACTAIAMSIIASLYPALYLTSFSPAFAIKGSFGTASKGKAFRYGLIGFQFVTSITLIICASFITMQRKYMMNYDMGFDKSNLINVRTTWKVANARQACMDRLLENPQIKDITWADGNLVAASRMGWGREFKGERISYECYPVTWNFLKFMGIEITEGRDFTESDEVSETGVYIFNEAARDKFGLTTDDKLPGHNGPAEIAGFCKNFNYKSLESEIKPFALYIFGKHTWKITGTLYIRTAENADMAEVFSHIRNVLSELDPSVSPDEIDISLFDETLDRQYKKEQKTSTIVTLFTILAIVISLMGVFGLVMFDAEHRRKEIGVRRANGAEIKDIILMFNIKFVKIVFICFLIAAPLAYAVTDLYLRGFAFRMKINPWVFVLALAAVLSVTIAVVTARSLSAALADPVESLKSE